MFWCFIADVTRIVRYMLRHNYYFLPRVLPTIEANGIAIYGMHVHVVIKRDVGNQGGACVIVTNHQNGRQKTALLQKRAAFVAVLISRDT